MKKPTYNLSRSQKILLTLYEVSGRKKKYIKFEDFAVALFKVYPDEFHLRGYPEYPDTGESIHRPLYKAKEMGLVSVSNKFFSLTERGLELAEKLKKEITNKKPIPRARLSGFADKEISRIKKLEGFRLFLEGQLEKILDIDFYNYLGISARTEKSEFLGRLKTIEDTIKEIEGQQQKEPIYKGIVSYHKFIINRFREIINYHKNQ